MAGLSTPRSSPWSPKGLKSVLLVDQRDSSRLVTKWFLSNFGYTVQTARTTAEALSLFNPDVHDLVITDQCASNQHGVSIAQVIKSLSPSTPVILFSHEPPGEGSGLDAFVPKPGHLLLLKSAIDEMALSRSIAS